MAGMRLVAIASREEDGMAFTGHLMVPVGVNLDTEYEAWRRWYKEVYCPNYHAHPRGGPEAIKFQCFSEWLRDKGACEPLGSELEVFEER